MQSNRSSSKCFFYTLLIFVILCAALLIFSLIVLQVRAPKLHLQSTKITYLQYDLSPSLSLILQARLRIKNRNYGRLKFDGKTTALSLNFGDSSIGAVKLDKAVGQLDAKSKKVVNVAWKVNGYRASETDYVGGEVLRNQLNSGFIELGIYGQWKGRVNWWGKIERGGAAGQVNCTVRIDLKKQDVRTILC